VLSGGCEEDIYSPSWDPIDYGGLVQDFSAPTGSLVDGSPQETAAVIETELGNAQDVQDDVVLLYEQMEVMIDVIEERQENALEPNTVNKGSVHGTNVYARISCLGPNLLDRSTDFEYGEIRLEGSDFSLNDALKSGFTFGGDMLAAFRECRMKNKTVRGVNPAFASVENGDLLVDLDISIEESDETEHRARYPFLLRRNEIHILADTGARGTYVLSIRVGGDRVITITTAEGIFGCSIGLSGLTCDNIATFGF
jgi:hypothetical protein